MLPLVLLSCLLFSQVLCEDTKTESPIVVLTGETITDKIKEGIWLINFYAPWCGHCKRLAPIWEELATDLEGEINVAMLDATEEEILARKWGVRAYPTVKLVKEGKVYDFKEAKLERTFDNIKSFAQTSHVGVTPQPVPSPPAVWDPVLIALEQIKEEVEVTYNSSPYGVGVITIGSFLIGMIVGSLALKPIPRVNVVYSDNKKKEQ